MEFFAFFFLAHSYVYRHIYLCWNITRALRINRLTIITIYLNKFQLIFLIIDYLENK